MVCNLGGETDTLHLNRGEFFVDRAASTGLAAVSRRFTRFGVGLVDFDADGHLDLYEACGRVLAAARLHGDDPYAEPNLLLRGTPGPRFEEVSPRGGTAALLVASSRAAAFGDVDGDGAVDVLVANRDGPAHLLRNVAPGRGRWLLLRIVDRRGADALNARVTLTVGDRTVTREVRAASSYLASSDPRVHVGLGTEEHARDVVVRFPDGTEERYGTLAAGEVHVLRQPDG